MPSKKISFLADESVEYSLVIHLRAKDKIRAFDRLLDVYSDKLRNSFIVVDELKVRIRA